MDLKASGRTYKNLLREPILKKINLYNPVLSIFLTMGMASLMSSCDESSQPEKMQTEKESKNSEALEETVEEAEGTEEAQEAIKKKSEQEEKENEARKEKREEKNLMSENSSRKAVGAKRR